MVFGILLPQSEHASRQLSVPTVTNFAAIRNQLPVHIKTPKWRTNISGNFFGYDFNRHRVGETLSTFAPGRHIYLHMLIHSWWANKTALPGGVLNSHLVLFRCN